MAIVKVGTYRNPPETITDYEAIVAHLEAYTRQIGNQGMILTEWTNNTTQPKIAMGSYISHGGVLYVVDDEDYGISFPSVTNGEYYLIAIPLGATSLIINRITDPSYYTWNPIYNGFYNSTGHQLLPYKVTYSEGKWYKYKLLSPAHVEVYKSLWVDYLGNLESAAIYANGPIECTGAISGASVDTGQGATEVHLMDQNVRTIDNVTFSRLGIITSIRQIGFNGSTTGVMDNINIGELVNVTFQGWSSSVSQRVCILPSGLLFCVALQTGGMEGAVVSTGVKTGGSTIATVEAGLPDVTGILRVWRIA